MKLGECTVVVNSCDAYEDVWAPFFAAFKDKWESCPYKIVLNTESKSFAFNGLGITSFPFGTSEPKDMWGKRLRRTLSSIDSEFVIMLFDDFILEDKVNGEEVFRCIERMKADKQIAVFYFNKIAGDNISENRFLGYDLLPPRSDYRLNSAPAIWRKDKLFAFTGDGDTPWAWEYFGSARTYRTSDLFYCAKLDAEHVFRYQYKLGGAIHRGKWVRSVIEPAVKKYGLSIDFSRRGFQDEGMATHPHSLFWKIDFLFTGLQMVGLDAFIFVYRGIRRRLFRIIGIKG